MNSLSATARFLLQSKDSGVSSGPKLSDSLLALDSGIPFWSYVEFSSSPKLWNCLLTQEISSGLLLNSLRILRIQICYRAIIKVHRIAIKNCTKRNHSLNSEIQIT